MKAAGMNYTRLIGIMVLALVIGAGMASAAGVVVSSAPDKASPLPGDTVNVLINIDLTGTGKTLAEYTIEIRWNPAVIQYQSVAGGTTPEFSQVDAVVTDVLTGKLQISGLNITGSSGKVNVARVVFKAIGTVGDQSFIDLVAASLSASDLADLLPQHTVQSGQVTILGPPALVSPADLSYIPVSQSFTRTWGATPNAASYQLQESFDASFTTIAGTQTLTATAYTASCDTARKADSPVYWRVRALVGGTWGAWSTAWRFYTDLGPLELLFPEDLAYVPEGELFSYRWSQVLNATEYQLVSSGSSDFAGVTPVTVTGATFSASIAGEYTVDAPFYWRVRARVDGQYGDWSETHRIVTRQFTAYAPPTSVIVADVPGDNGHSLKLTWTLSADDASLTHYYIYRSRSSQLSDTCPSIESFTSLEALIAAEENTTILIARVPRGTVSYTDSTIPLNGVSYYYWIQSVAESGTSKPAPAGYVTSVDEQPVQFRVSAPYPNPFNASTTIEYVLPEPGEVCIIMYNAVGQAVRSYDLGYTIAGSHRFVLSPDGLTSGMYLFRLDTGYAFTTGKLLYMK